MNTNLLYSYLQSQCSDEERHWVEQKLDSDPDFRREYEVLKLVYQKSADYSYKPSDKQEAWNRIQEQVNSPVKTLKKRKSKHLWWSAAAILIVVFSATLLLKNQGGPTTISYVAGEQVEQFDLPDGSKVWLNAHSKLEYTDNKSKNIRETALDGVGFFVVKPNSNKKFEVASGHLKVLVVGTSFEVDHDKVLVSEGLVNVMHDSKVLNKVTLGKNEAVQYSQNKWNKYSFDREKVALWRTQLLKFKDESLSDIVKTVEDHYQIKVIFEKAILDHKFTLNFEGLDLEDVIDVLEEVTQTKVKISGREYRFKA